MRLLSPAGLAMTVRGGIYEKTVLAIIGVIALMLLLAGAAYVGGQLYQAQQAPVGKAHEPRKQQVTPAAAVPLAPPDGRGEVQSQDSNSIMICDPQSPSQPSIDKNGVLQESNTCSPQFEVVITHDTVLLHDVTGRTYVTPQPNGDLVMQEVVEPSYGRGAR